MALQGLPQDATVTGSIEIVRYLTSDGEGVTFGIDDLSKETAIGFLMVILDRLREERKLEWDTCPDCFRPWDEHFEEDEDEEDD